MLITRASPAVGDGVCRWGYLSEHCVHQLLQTLALEHAAQMEATCRSFSGCSSCVWLCPNLPQIFLTLLNWISVPSCFTIQTRSRLGARVGRSIISWIRGKKKSVIGKHVHVLKERFHSDAARHLSTQKYQLSSHSWWLYLYVSYRLTVWHINMEVIATC